MLSRTRSNCSFCFALIPGRTILKHTLILHDLHERVDAGGLPAPRSSQQLSLLRSLTRRANIEVLGRLQHDFGGPVIWYPAPSVCGWGGLLPTCAWENDLGSKKKQMMLSTWPSTYFAALRRRRGLEWLNQVVSSTSILCPVVVSAWLFCRRLCCRAATILQHQWWSAELFAAVVPQARQPRFCSRLPLQLLHPTIHPAQSAAVASLSLDGHPGSASARPHFVVLVSTAGRS